MPRLARAALVSNLGAMLCALTLTGCDGGDMGAGPADETEGEAQALADAEAMLELREAPANPAAESATPSATLDGEPSAD